LPICLKVGPLDAKLVILNEFYISCSWCLNFKIFILVLVFKCMVVRTNQFLNSVIGFGTDSSKMILKWEMESDQR